MTTAIGLKLTSCGYELDTSATSFGELRKSSDMLGDADALRERMREDGYLYLPNYLDRDLVLEARQVVTAKLAAEGHLDLGTDTMEAVAQPGSQLRFKPDLADNNEPLHRLLYSGRLMEFYERLLGGAVRHFDFTWMRAVAPGGATRPHCDIVFMGRGTQNLFTAWTPLGDISLEIGGLMILENSHRLQRIGNSYGRKDVDSYCANRKDAKQYASGEKRWGGWLSPNPVLLRERLGGRWLTSEFHAGDLLTVGMFTIHASLDNHSDRIRLSSDSRYQLASEPFDERWVGEAPVGHSSAGKRGRIC
jgi:hypothetical protein